MRRVDNILPELIADVASPRIFLKMDTQGFDHEVLDGAKQCLPLIVGLQSEISVVPLYDGMVPYTESLASYQRLGFELMGLYVVNTTSDRRILEYDCLMARSTELRSTQPR
jgi:hypothetical protein